MTPSGSPGRRPLPPLPSTALVVTGLWVVLTCAVAVVAGVLVAALMTGALWW